MKKIVDYVKSLLPFYDRRDILSVVEQLRAEYTDTIEPVLSSVREDLGKIVIKSPYYQRYTTELAKHVNSRKAPIVLLTESLEQLQKNFTVLENEIRGSMGNTVASDAITYDKATVFRYIDGIAFYLRFTRKFLLAVVADVSAAVGGTPSNITRAEKEFLEQNMPNFAGMFLSMYIKESELKALFKKASTAVVEEETSNMVATSLGNRTLDPLSAFAFTPQGNPILSIGKMLVEWRFNRHQAAKADLQALQMRLQELRELQENGNTSPKLQQFIVNLEERIKKLDAKVAKYEESIPKPKEF